MCLLDLIEEHHRVGLPPDGLCQLSTLVVAHIARRRTDQTAHAILLLILRHVDSCHHRLVVEEVVCQSLGEFGLTNTRRTQEDKRGDRSFRILQTCPTAPDGIRYRRDSLLLSDDTLVEFIFQMEQFLALALHHLCHGDTRPAAHDLCDVVGCHLLAH